MNAVIMITGLAIIITKFLDCYSTSRMNNASMEKNPLARWMMGRFGFRNTIWGVFVLAVIITGLAVYEVIARDSLIYKTAFILSGSIISYAQYLVYRANTGHGSYFTLQLARIYNKFN
jgi:hypothetical protein